MSDRMREDFEARFPTPEDVVWAGNEYRFVGKTPSQGMIYFIEFNSKWEGWQASRESLVIELPELLQTKPYQTVDRGSENYKSGFNRAVFMSAANIGGAGLKVKP